MAANNRGLTSKAADEISEVASNRELNTITIINSSEVNDAPNATLNYTNMTVVGIEPANLSVINNNSEVDNDKNATLNKKKHIYFISKNLKIELYNLIIKLCNCIINSIDKKFNYNYNLRHTIGTHFFEIISDYDYKFEYFKNYNDVMSFLNELLSSKLDTYDFKLFTKHLITLFYLSVLTLNNEFLDIINDNFDLIISSSKNLYYCYKNKQNKNMNYKDQFLDYIYRISITILFEYLYTDDFKNLMEKKLSDDDFEIDLDNQYKLHSCKIIERISLILIKKITNNTIKISDSLIINSLSNIKNLIKINVYLSYSRFSLKINDYIHEFIETFKGIYLPNTCDLLIMQSLMAGRSKIGKFSNLSNRFVKNYFLTLFVSKAKLNDLYICDDVKINILRDCIHNRNYTSLFIKENK